MHFDVSRAYFHAKGQRPVLVKLRAEDCSGKDREKIGRTEDAANNWERDWQGHLENWGYELARSSRSLLHTKTRNTSGVTHVDDFVVTGTKGSLLELKKQLGSVYPIKASIIGAGSTKSIKALNRRICWGETWMLCQHDLRPVDVLVESLGLENGNTVQTLILDDGDSGVVRPSANQQVQISGGHMLVPQSRQSRHNLCRERVVPKKNFRSYATELRHNETTRSVLAGRE